MVTESGIGRILAWLAPNSRKPMGASNCGVPAGQTNTNEPLSSPAFILRRPSFASANGSRSNSV